MLRELLQESFSGHAGPENIWIQVTGYHHCWMTWILSYLQKSYCEKVDLNSAVRELTRVTEVVLLEVRSQKIWVGDCLRIPDLSPIHSSAPDVPPFYSFQLPYSKHMGCCWKKSLLTASVVVGFCLNQMFVSPSPSVTGTT